MKYCNFKDTVNNKVNTGDKINLITIEVSILSSIVQYSLKCSHFCVIQAIGDLNNLHLKDQLKAIFLLKNVVYLY